MRLRITLGDMPLEDTFYLDVGPPEAATSIGELLERVFTGGPGTRAATKAGLDVRGNPDLPEMYGALLDVFDGWRAGRCELAIRALDERRIELRDSVHEHVRRSTPEDSSDPAAPVLHLVLEQTFDPMGYAFRQGCFGSERELLEWLQETALLWLAESAEGAVPLLNESRPHADLMNVVARLRAGGLATDGEGGSILRLTDSGRGHVEALVQEAESYIDRFDLFRDVLLDGDGETADFGSGRGDDLRVQVYEWEGVNPVRAVCLLRLYDGTAVEGPARPWEAMLDRAWLQELLRPVVDRRHVDDIRLERVLDSGYTLLEETEEEEAREEGRRAVLGRGAPV